MIKNKKLDMRVTVVELEALKKLSKELNKPISKIIRERILKPLTDK